jgi:hypothetical protein
MANLETNPETNIKVEDVSSKVETTSTKNVIVGGAKKTFLTLYKLWIKKYKYPLFAFIAMITFYIAHQQKSFIEVKKLFKKKS